MSDGTVLPVATTTGDTIDNEVCTGGSGPTGSKVARTKLVTGARNTDGGDVSPTNPLPVADGSHTSSTGAFTNVAASATVVTLLPANANRKRATIYNEPGGAILYLGLGAGATTTAYTVQVAPGGYYETSGYTGIITGLWASASGDARITELT